MKRVMIFLDGEEDPGNPDNAVGSLTLKDSFAEKLVDDIRIGGDVIIHGAVNKETRELKFIWLEGYSLSPSKSRW